MTQTRLTQEQIRFFNTFGYLTFPGLLADGIDRIIEEFEKIWRDHGGGHDNKQHEGKARSCIVPFPDQSEYLSSLLDDPRIHDIIASLLGDDFNYTSGDGNFYVGDTQWHSDGYDGNRIHGEAMLRTAGPERMVHLQQVIDNDFKVKEVHARLRQERAEPSRG